MELSGVSGWLSDAVLSDGAPSPCRSLYVAHHYVSETSISMMQCERPGSLTQSSFIRCLVSQPHLSVEPSTKAYTFEGFGEVPEHTRQPRKRCILFTLAQYVVMNLIMWLDWPIVHYVPIAIIFLGPFLLNEISLLESKFKLRNREFVAIVGLHSITSKSQFNSTNVRGYSDSYIGFLLWFQF